MVTFSSPFFSLSGQKERLANVGSTLLSAITGKGVIADTGNQTANKILSTAASNPFTTAGIAAVAVSPTSAANLLKSGFGALSPTGKIVAVAATPVVIGAVASNPSLIGKTARAPKELSQFGSDVGGFVKNPSIESAKNIIKGSPLISTGIAAAGIAAIGPGLANTIATAANTRALNRSTIESSPPFIVPSENFVASSIPLTPETQVLGREVKSGVARKSRRLTTVSRSNSPSVRISLLNQNTYIQGRQ